jgi:hypothetical protein
MILFFLCMVILGETFDKVGNVDIFLPDPNAYRFLSTSSARILKPNTIYLTSDIYFWGKPSVSKNNSWLDTPVENRVINHYSFAYAPLEKWSIAMSIPFLLQQNYLEQESRGKGDIVIQTKHAVLNDESKLFTVALASDFSLPSGDDNLYISNSKITVFPSAIVEFNSKDNKYRLASEVGYFFPKEQTYSGRGYKFLLGSSVLLKNSLEIISEYQRYSSNNELTISNLGFGFQYSKRLYVVQGMIVAPRNAELSLSNIQYSLGVILKPSWEYQSRDEDSDGILNKVDKCPNEKEDFDGYLDHDGCPEPDNDQDGILDLQDECSLEKEDLDGFLDEDGCLDADNDQDNILDYTDRCPNKAETVNGYRDFDGCPDFTSGIDFDGDRLPDDKDECPLNPEDFDGYMDHDGCPEIDNDNDGVLDQNDQIIHSEE